MIRSIGIVCLAVLGFEFQANQQDATEQSQKQTVRVEDLGTKIDVIGRLGLPLHSFATIHGRWERPKGRVKDNGLYFFVTKVNDRVLQEGARIHLVHVENSDHEEIAPVEGESWVIRGYESATLEPTAPTMLEVESDEIGSRAMSSKWTFCTSEVRGILKSRNRARKGD
jgi:hypothetical protein